MYRSHNIYVDVHILACARAYTHKHSHTHTYTQLLHFHELCFYSIDTPHFSQIDLKVNQVLVM